LWDATIDSQKLLSCICRIAQKSAFAVGWQHIADVLVGAQTERMRSWGHDTLSTYGIGKDKPKQEWINLGRQLALLGFAEVGKDKYPTVTITPKGMTALRDRISVRLPRPITASLSSVAVKAPITKAGEIPCDDGLFQQLRVLRKSLADSRNVPAYVIFSDVTLRHIARAYPCAETAFLALPGVGERKLTEFGEPFIKAVGEWLKDNPRQSFPDLKQSQSAPKNPPPNLANLGATVLETLRRFRAGDSMETIAEARRFTLSTIEGHLTQAIEFGENLEPASFYTPEEAKRMRESFLEHEVAPLSPIFERLGGAISYGKLKIFRAFATRKQGNS
jgi:ATP-dependent DNA helicase RecQ